MILQWVGIVFGIIVVDLALSGDNALVIGAVAARLKEPRRRYAIIFGGVMAVVLRILLAEGALFVLQVPYIQAIGGLLVLGIAVQLISERRHEDADGGEPMKRFRILRWLRPDTLFGASLTILVADFTMSLDNVLSVAALARGNYVVLLIGILFSMLLLLVASSVIARLIERFPLLLYLAAGILSWTAGWMVLNDKALAPFIQAFDNQVPGPPLAWLIPPLFLVLAFLAWLTVRAFQHTRDRKPRPGDV